MLSNPTNLQKRQRQHRRQNSTPIFEAPKVPILPTLQRHASHRRGMSLDQRPRRQSPTQDTNRLVTTNYGFHVLQETQPQILRPGPALQAHLNMTNDENYLISPLVTPHRQEFDIGCGSMYGELHEPASPYSPYCDQIDTAIRVNANDMSPGYHFGVHDSSFPSSGTVSPSTYVDFSMGFDMTSSQDDWCNTIKPASRRPVTRRISGGIAGRVARFESMAPEQPNFRPITPPTQNVINYFPPTPSQTPYNAALRIESIPLRFQEDYDTSMEATIKPSSRRNNQRASAIFQDLREHAQMNNPPSPPGSASIPSSSTFDSARMPPASFMNISNVNLDFMHNDGGYESSFYSPAPSNKSPEHSRPSSPEVSQTALLNDAFDEVPNLDTQQSSTYLSASTSTVDHSQPMSPPDSSQMQRSTSVESFNLDETITDTGITIDDIACYISGPDPKDQKWLCLYPECKKRFGRKENIKSHVQTHLGDRQYQCPHCQKCFVRQHDLKRHAKIHSGVKPYPCACGNSFARHDALTRHRQRGMCIGAFEGVVKKVVKRGRPRKHRPDNEERLDKSSRTRNKNKGMSSASSVSNDSESSYGLSPPADFNVLDERPFGDFNGFPQDSTTMSGGSFAYSPPPPMTDCVSPQATQNAHSPSAFSTHSHHSRHSRHHNHHSSVASIASHHLPSHPPSPAKSHTSLGQSYSQYNTPPELCLSSSSPPSSTKFYDIAEHDDMMGLSKLDEIHAVNDDHMFLNAFADSSIMGMTRLEQDPELLLMGGKFDDAFAVVDDSELFGTGSNDVFFGSP